jgi:hypothetical protein
MGRSFKVAAKFIILVNLDTMTNTVSDGATG